MVLKPLGNRFCSSFRQEIHDPMRVAVDKYRAVHPTTAQRKIVYPKHTWDRSRLEWGAMNQPQDGRGTSRHTSALALPTSSFTAESETKVKQCVGQSLGALRRRCQ
jgi:hypothetical protein